MKSFALRNFKDDQIYISTIGHSIYQTCRNYHITYVSMYYFEQDDNTGEFIPNERLINELKSYNLEIVEIDIQLLKVPTINELCNTNK